MDVPPEVLIAPCGRIRNISRCATDGKLANRVSSSSPTRGARRRQDIVDGNERVLRARLARRQVLLGPGPKARLEDRLPALKDIVFHAKLGTQAERVERIEALAGEIAETCGRRRAEVDRAARLCKADLSTGMVGEFPELQGVMGRYYALRRRRLRPRSPTPSAITTRRPGPNDRCPTAPVSIAWRSRQARCLIGFLSIGEKPTGSRDPFALRRAALGIIRIVVENKLRLPLQASSSRPTT